MKNILFPTDFSANAEQAFRYAKAVAKQLDASLTVLHAYHISTAIIDSTPSLLLDVLEQEHIDFAQQRFQTLMEGTKEDEGVNYADLDIQYELSLGFAVDKVVSYTKENAIDLIIMGTKGAKNFSDRILGSITSTVIKRVKCPVLAIPENAVFTGLKNIALAVNMKEEELPAFRQLILFAKAFGSNVHAVHISKKKNEEDYNYDIGLGDGIEVTFSERFNDNLEKGLDEFIKEQAIDILGMITINRGFWNNLFHKSATKEMVLHTEVPLLAFHS